MRRIIYKKRWYFNNKKVLYLLIIFICINTFFYYLFFINRLSDAIIQTAEKELKEITMAIVTKNLTKDKLKKVTAEDLIIIHKNKVDEITDVSFKLDKAYDVLLDIKSNIEKEVRDIKKGIIPSQATAIKDNLVIKVPYYIFTGNALFMNLGPKIYIQINLLENIIGDVYTKISSYGINTVLINLYIKFYIKESFLYPVLSQKMEYEFEVLVASKVIQGKVPSFYNGLMESSSPIINVK